MPLISCCIIARNEAQRLPALLRSLSTVCEQIVVVDTGSTDNTAKLVRDLGADLGFFPWNDSFSDARNRSLEMARHPWILCMDADDCLPDRSLVNIAELKDEPPEKAYGFIIKSTQDGVTGMGSAQIRMFPNMEELRFKYRVHEQIRPALIKKGIPIFFTGIEIVHTGYTDKATVLDKQRRNIRLLEKDLEEYPEDGFLHYLAGLGGMDLGKWDYARNELQKAWQFSIVDPDKRHIALGSALELAEMALKKGKGDLQKALLWVERAEGLDKDYPRCLYLRALIDHEKGELENSLQSLKRLMTYKKPDLLLPLDITMLKSMAAALMGQIYMKTNRPQEAVSILEQAQKALKRRR